MKAHETTTLTALRSGTADRPDDTEPHRTGRAALEHSGAGEASRQDVVDCRARVLANVAVNREYRHLVLKAAGAALAAKAGQFFNIACPVTGSEAPFLRRPMSLYRADAAAGEIEFLYKITGLGTRQLAGLRAGDTVDILGPLGKGFVLDPAWRHIVVVGRGVGLATLAPLAELAAVQGVGITAILSARDPSLVMSVERFAAAGADVRVVTDADGSSDPLNVESILRELIAEGRADALFTCGSNRLMQLLKRLSLTLGIPGQVAMEQQMACGLGMCFCCVRPFRGEAGTDLRRVCHDGPVFPIAEALSW